MHKHNFLVKVSFSIALAIFSFFDPLCGHGQSYTDLMNKLRYTPPTPEVASLFKFSEVPVDLSCGIPDINIDLYTVNSVSLQHNVSLSYHASGIRVNEIASVAGLGWNLNAGGAIMRNSRGKNRSNSGYNDESASFLNESDMNLTYIGNNLSMFDNIQKGIIDVEPDEYSFNVAGFSGKFFQDRNHNFVTNTKSNVKISRLTQGFLVVNGNGVQYYFDLPQYTDDMGIPLVNNITAWNLTKVLSADKKDSITFEYMAFTDYEPSVSFSYNQLGTVPGDGTVTCQPPFTPQWTFQSSAVQLKYINNVIQKVNFSGGYVQFNYSNREDRKNSGDYLPRLSEVKVFDASNKLIKFYSFVCDVFQSSGNTDIAPYSASVYNSIDYLKWLRLNQINILDANNQSIPYYKFAYNTTVLPARYNFSQDYWGFYNGKINTNPIRSRTMTNTSGGTTTVGGANKNPDAIYAQASILTKLTYPTSGYTTFEYEGNMASSALSGGVRIKAIKNYSSTNVLAKQEDYAYGTDGSGTQLTNSGILMDDYFSYQMNQFCPIDQYNNVYCKYLNYRVDVVKDVSIGEIGFLSGSPVAYSKVTKVVSDLNSGTKLKTEYNYDIMDLNVEWPMTITVAGRVNRPINNCWKGARLLSQIDYKDNGGGSFLPLRVLTNTYGRQLDTTLTNVVVPIFQENQFVLCTPTERGFSYLTYPLRTEKILPLSTTVTTYKQDGTGGFDEVTNYEYDRYNLDYYLRNKLTNTSLGTFYKKELKYPFDFSADPVAVKMVNNNILDAPLQVSDYQGAETTATKTVMKDWFGDGLVLETNIVELYRNGTKVKDAATVNSMNNYAKVLEMVDENGLTNSMIWDARNKNLVAKVVNAGQVDIAFSGFEDGNKGGWSYSGSPLFDKTSPTGNYCYNLTSGQISKSGLSTTKTYVVSYWKKTGSVSVNSTSGTGGRSVNGWTYYEHKIVNPAAGTITITGTGGVLDELRLIPDGAVEMTTMAYDPLVGVTSVCDKNNRINYYYYDGFGRLVLIRDQDLNIIKQYCYNYSGQTENCSVFSNVQKQGTFNKSNCTGCNYGSGVTYTVPAGSYFSTFSQADADGLAQADVNTNGQAYANSLGTCSAPVSSSVTGNNGISSKGFTIIFSNNNASCSPTSYNKTLNAGASNFALGPMNTGNYNVNFAPVGGGSTAYTYRVNGFTIHTITGTIYNVDLVSSGNQVQVTP